MNPNLEMNYYGSIPERVFRQVRELIVRGRLSPGSRLVESALASRFGVSRTPVREALAWLAHEGFAVPESPARRTQYLVAPLSPSLIRELWGTIGALERYAIGRTIMMDPLRRNQLTDDLSQLNQDLSRASISRPRDPEWLFELQSAFHLRFVYEVSSRRFREIYDSVRPHVQRYEWIYGTKADSDYRPSIREHAQIIAAILSGDLKEAQQMVESHWARAADRTAHMIERHAQKKSPTRKPKREAN